MRRINIILYFILISVGILAQNSKKIKGAGNNINAYIGTWVYQSNDTIFKIVFQKGKKISPYGETHGLYGGYYLSVKGEVLEDYMGPLPTCWNLEISTTTRIICISGHLIVILMINQQFLLWECLFMISVRSISMVKESLVDT